MGIVIGKSTSGGFFMAITGGFWKPLGVCWATNWQEDVVLPLS
jgi:hypothetical protein